ncbi:MULTISPECIES: glutamate 5-kinase [Clostridium]|uniref:glutamate 5-kinase n=1 Tax=Clostridium TaxID=1485 RepID=UPI00069D8C1A|nr:MULTISPECIES: glutamate 5-kinase [Clostridium]KOF56167.1 gamma-glutamyl kinase [Clostridium sp. DMHC 10]MCD2348219.1 glutamate 5-kinase [Clostridium guangxiense]
MNDRENYLGRVRKVVIKVGSSTITHPNGLLNLYRIEHLVRQISDLNNRGLEVVLVTSGAIGAGFRKLGFKEKPKSIPENQAAAAVGQGILMHTYEKFFSEYGQTVAQILINREDIFNEERFENAQNTFSELLKKSIIPIVNENDATIVEEIKFGDNDTLSAHVASLIGADLLILLSDIDGLYNCNPRTNPDAILISKVDEITTEIEDSAEGAGSNLGTGGMFTKIKAAKIATEAGASMIIANGEAQNVIVDLLNYKNIGTLFISHHN